ncbi:PAS domain S-box protein [Natrarchaeobius oligotrophus]|uniref:histidine kinase n=1 Tax=Natrarchaeobius chitinivorans TaxID=1679083 RepID=A0A3N6MSP5_NATCH|nr:PAS domain S-box protein [Natrarchaeobius chitinivorans]RQH00841.1 PAS domain S-box protein [Natrarchaeobius chitinivorans]
MSDQGEPTGERIWAERDLVEEVVETSPIGIAVVDATGTVTFANEHAEEIYGRSREELNEYTHDDSRWDLVNEDGEPLASGEAPFNRVVSEEEAIYDQIIGLRRPSGERVWVSVNGSPQWNDDGELKRAVFAFEDVSEKHELEAELDEILGRVTDAFYALDDEFRFTHVNERAEELLRASEEELLGETLWELYPEAADIDDVWDAFHTAMETQEPRSYDLYYDPLEFWVEATVYPSETGVSVYFQDVTERKERERELERSNEQLETLFRVLPIGVMVADAEGSLRKVNDAANEIWGGTVYDADSIEEYERYTGWWADTGEPVTSEEWTMARVLDGESVVEPDVFEIETFDGERRIVMVHGMPIRNDRGEVVRGVVVQTDITERKEYERKLKESNERLEQFAYAASHDLQEPLRMVTSYLSLIERKHGDTLDDDGEEFLEFAVDGAERMREMIDGLLAYSRIESQGEPFEPTDLDEVFEDVRADLRIRIESSDATITRDSLPRVHGDDGQLRQVFQNLLSNAIEYSGEKPPRIHVSAVREGSKWRISVRDEGVGIDSDDPDRVFEVFQRLHSREEIDGTGIGLALCKRIVERHDGEIWVDSEPGEGSTFAFTLPAVDATDR